MVSRCTNPANKQFADYGGRGITVCERWQDFDTFCDDVGPHPGAGMTLGRIENGLGYAPENVRWETRAQQNRNRRNVKLSLDSIETAKELRAAGVTLKTLAKRSNVSIGTLWSALKGQTWVAP